MQPAHRSDDEHRAPQEKVAPPAEERLLAPQDVLALQPHAGNAAMARMLSRQPETQAPPAAQNAAGDMQRDLARRFLEMGAEAFFRAFPNIIAAAGMGLSPGGPDHAAGMRAQAMGDIAVAKAMFEQAAQLRGAVGLGIGAVGARDPDRRIDQALLELNMVSFPVLLGMLGGGPGIGAALMGMVQRTFQVVIDLRNQMILAGLPVPPAPAAPPPGRAAPPAE